MPKNLILKTQANDLFEAIGSRGLNPAEFLWVERESIMTPGLIVSSLAHQPTGFYYVFDYKNGRHFSEFSPGKSSGMSREFPGDWVNQWGYAMGWLDSLKQNYEAPDLWGAISQETRLAEVASAAHVNNAPFASQEQSEISSRLREIESYLLTTQQLSQEKTEYVKNRLDYLEEASKRQGQQDWLHTAIGVLFTIVIGVGLTPNAAADLFRFFATVFGSLLNGIRALP